MTPALHYLLSRHLKKSTIIEWQLGFCHDWKVVTPDVIKAGHYAIVEKTGLIKSKQSTVEQSTDHSQQSTVDRGQINAWDFFHHRITIPIHDMQGRVIGFGGRTLPTVDSQQSTAHSGQSTADRGPKYMNPPESPIYNKSKTLFGLYQATKHFKEHGMAVLVEGYFDVIKLHQEHFNNTVGTCGTALTDGQAKQLKRFTDTVLVLRDGDKAGSAATEKDIPILLAHQFNVLVATLPRGMDPDSYFDQCIDERLYDGHFYTPTLVALLNSCVDGITYMADIYMADRTTNGIVTGIQKLVTLLASITNQVRREQYIKIFAKNYKLKTADFTRPITQLLQAREDERKAEEAAKTEGEDEYEALPKWVDRKRLELDGFVQLLADTKGYRAGIYFLNSNSRSLYKVTNFTIKPLYHIFEQSNNRRLIEVDNATKNSVVEMPTQAFVNQSMFEVELLNKGTFRCDDSLSRKEFKRMTGWLLDNMPIAYELKTLGWQPEGFFAFSNAVHVQTQDFASQLIEYDDLGMIAVGDKHFMSLGNSKIHREDRGVDNPYENDLFLKYCAPRADLNFEKWSHLFYDSYGIHAPFGIAFTFLTLFKDLVTRVAKMPLLYCYGQKGSGKSSMAESITWLFFSGKDGEGNLIKGFNLNPGQSTPFSFFNRVERFRNCPILMNEFDENSIEPWKSGTMKAAYDGEGREVGDGDTGKKRKTKIQKVQGTIILVGQYLATKDDAAVSSRSIPAHFSLERLKDLTKPQIESFNTLRTEEQQGLSGILTELMKHRPEVQKRLAKNFADIQTQLMNEMRSEGFRIEARLISNYSLMLAATKSLMDLGIRLPYTYESFYEQAKERMVKHNQTLKDNSIVQQFWKSIEVLFDSGLITGGNQIQITHFAQGINIKEGSQVTKQDVKGEVLLVRFSNAYSLYAKYHRERTGQAAQSEETVLMYLKEQSYFIGLTPSETFSDKRTSAYAFNYEAMKDMGIVLEKNQRAETPKAQDIAQTSIEPDWVNGK